MLSILIFSYFLRILILQINFGDLSEEILFSVGGILSIWLLVKECFQKSEFKYLPEVSALFLAISPWHLQLSRYPEITFLVVSLTLVAWVFVKLIRKYAVWLFLVYLFSTLFVISSFLPQALRQGISDNYVVVWLTEEQRREHNSFYNNFFVKLLHNKVINYSLSFLDHYSEHFSGEFLFIVGDVREDKKILDFGMMYLYDSILLVFGIFIIAKYLKDFILVLIWLFLAPINSAIDFQPPNLLKSALMIVPLVLISASGFINLLNLMSKYLKGNWIKEIIRYIFILLIITIIVWDFSRFLHNYALHLDF